MTASFSIRSISYQRKISEKSLPKFHSSFVVGKYIVMCRINYRNNFIKFRVYRQAPVNPDISSYRHRTLQHCHAGGSPQRGNVALAGQFVNVLPSRFIVKHQSQGLAIAFLLGAGLGISRINGELKSPTRQISWFRIC